MLHPLKTTIYCLFISTSLSGFKRCLFIFFLFFFSDSVAQTAIINGTVKDGETMLQSATVIVSDKKVLTNYAGEFSVTISPGSYTMFVTHVGYKKIEQPIILTGRETKSFHINMTKEEQLDNVVVLGSRSNIQRSNLNTTVPVDRITSKELKQTGQPSLIQMLSFTVPSFNTSRQNLFEQVTLRGLSPDHSLILMNGSRYHNPSLLNQGSIKGTLGRGGVGNDLNSIPFSAIEKIEILRDGASTQYGSDAIAGVVNIVLKKSTGRTSVNLQLGQQYKGDGETIVFGINRGISLSKKGFLNFSGDLRCRNTTHRGGEYLGSVYYNIPANAGPSMHDSIIALDNKKIQERGFSRKTPVSNDGNIALASMGFLVNGGYAINGKMELFWTGAINYRHPVYQGAYRFPKNTNQVNPALYPDGFKNESIVNTTDVSVIVGTRGKTRKDWKWEWSSIYGQNSGVFYWKNTDNASQFALLGAYAPTEFYGGKTRFIQQANAISIVKDFAKKIGRVKTFNICFGAEYRIENYSTSAGEEAAWKNYDSSGKTQGGAQPSPGVSPGDVVNETRTVTGLYADLETDINDHLLTNVSARYEHYNDFGDNIAGKLAIRYKFSPAFSVRGSIGNGYHAPSLQQFYYTSTASGFKKLDNINVPLRIGTFSNVSMVARDFGIRPLQPEKALNLSAGFTSIISQHVNLAIDAYWIQIKNRIVLSGIFDKTNPEVKKILQDVPDIDQVQFITNAINTKTRGIDFVLNGNWKMNKANIGFILAANITRTNVFGPVQTSGKLIGDSLNTNTLFNREEREKIEHGQPGSKIIFSANYKIGKTEFLFRGTRFGKTSAVFNSAIKSQDEFFSPKVLTDLSITYTPKKWMTISTGVNNVFDVYPDRLKNSINTNQGVLIYSNEAMQFGYNGGYYFATLGLLFN